MSFRPFRRLCPRTNLIMREVRDINLKDQIVIISPSFPPRHLQLKYDYLVVALGSITNFQGMPGMMENAMPFRTLADAMVLTELPLDRIVAREPGGAFELCNEGVERAVLMV